MTLNITLLTLWQSICFRLTNVLSNGMLMLKPPKVVNKSFRYKMKSKLRLHMGTVRSNEKVFEFCFRLLGSSSLAVWHDPSRKSTKWSKIRWMENKERTWSGIFGAILVWNLIFTHCHTKWYRTELLKTRFFFWFLFKMPRRVIF